MLGSSSDECWNLQKRKKRNDNKLPVITYLQHHKVVFKWRATKLDT